MTQNQVGFIVSQVVIITLIVGGILLLVWNQRRGIRLRMEAESRGETIPKRVGLRMVFAFIGVIIFITGILFLRH